MEPCSVAAPVAPHGACPPHNSATLHSPSCKVSPPSFFPAPPRRLFDRDRTGRASPRTEPLSKTFACGSPEIPSWGEGKTNLQGNAPDLNAKEVGPSLRHIALLRPSRKGTSGDVRRSAGTFPQSCGPFNTQEARAPPSRGRCGRCAPFSRTEQGIARKTLTPVARAIACLIILFRENPG